MIIKIEPPKYSKYDLKRIKDKIFPEKDSLIPILLKSKKVILNIPSDPKKYCSIISSMEDNLKKVQKHIKQAYQRIEDFQTNEKEILLDNLLRIEKPLTINPCYTKEGKEFLIPFGYYMYENNLIDFYLERPLQILSGLPSDHSLNALFNQINFPLICELIYKGIYNDISNSITLKDCFPMIKDVIPNKELTNPNEKYYHFIPLEYVSHIQAIPLINYSKSGKCFCEGESILFLEKHPNTAINCISKSQKAFRENGGGFNLGVCNYYNIDFDKFFGLKELNHISYKLFRIKPYFI